MKILRVWTEHHEQQPYETYHASIEHQGETYTLQSNDPWTIDRMANSVHSVRKEQDFYRNIKVDEVAKPSKLSTYETMESIMLVNKYDTSEKSHKDLANLIVGMKDLFSDEVF